MLQLTSADVVRHRLVKQIIDAYEKHTETSSFIKKEKKVDKTEEKEDQASTNDAE